MDILCYSGIPGSFKTCHGTRDCLKHYKKENSIIKKSLILALSYIPGRIGNPFREKMKYYNLFPYGKINNVYTSYPVLLDKKRNIYSRVWNIFAFNGNWSFLPNALFVDDEIQLKIDSDEYDDKDKKKMIAHIAKFCQAARHFGCNKIIFCTQHPSRLFKKMRNVASCFVQHKSAFILPFFKVGWIKTIQYYLLDDYGKYIPKDREERKKLPFEYKKKLVFANFRKVFNAYDSRYLAKYNYNKPLYDRGCYTNMKVDYEDLKPYFES